MSPALGLSGASGITSDPHTAERAGRPLASREEAAALQLPSHCAAFTKPFSGELDPTPARRG